MSLLDMFRKRTHDDTALEIDKKASKFAFQISERNEKWEEKTGRPIEERPGFHEDLAALEAMHEERRAASAQGRAAWQRKQAEFKAEMAALRGSRLSVR